MTLVTVILKLARFKLRYDLITVFRRNLVTTDNGEQYRVLC